VERPVAGAPADAPADAGAHARPNAHARALALLTGRAFSVEELRRRLARHGHPATEIEGEIERLVQVGLIDDHKFARQFARSRLASGGTAPRRIRQELARRGVQRGIADPAVDDVLADEAIDLAASIEQLARRRANALAKLDPHVQRRRLYAYLARRGYDADAVSRAVASVIGEAEPALPRRLERREGKGERRPTK
jgi:regulatory protein